MTTPSPELPRFTQLPEPALLFHSVRMEDRHVHPLEGLLQHGTYSRSTLGGVLDPIRVAIIAPSGQLSRVDELLTELQRVQRPRERQNYLPTYPGFSQVFGVRIVPTESSARIELPSHLDNDIASAETPHLLLAETLTRSLTRLQAIRHGFDTALIYLPDAWSSCFAGSPDEDFDLHDYVKAVSARLGIPSQIVRETGALAYPCRASVCWRLSIALYCKAGGVPWKLADMPSETAYVGLSYGLRPKNADGPSFVTCCSQVFDSDGSGLEFIAFRTDQMRLEGENPFLSRADMRRVLARSLELYQRRHGGESPKKIVVHKSTEFKREEIDGCFDALNSAEVELIQIQDNVAWRGIRIEQIGGSKSTVAAAPYPCHRGSVLQLGGREVLLWTQGNAPTAVAGRNFYKEGKGIPSPILLRRFAGHGPLEPDCTAVLGLSKMDWNNDSLYDRLPVTLTYAQTLSRTVRRLPSLASTPYQFRFFM